MEALIIGTVVVMLIGLSLQGPSAQQQPQQPPVVYIPVQAPPQQGSESGSGGVLWLLFLAVLIVLALLYGAPAL